MPLKDITPMTREHNFSSDSCGCDAENRLKSMVQVDAAMALIAGRAPLPEARETLSVSQARGRILARPVHAAQDMPPFDNAAMDGYGVDCDAFHGAGPWTFPVAARLPAGQAPFVLAQPTGVVRIFTGAPVPAGINAVIAQEQATRDGASVTFHARPKAGLNIRRAGGDMQAGQLVLGPGAYLGAAEIAALAGAGANALEVRGVLRVGLLVTGDEIRGAGDARGHAEIWDVNTPMLRAAIPGPGVALTHVARIPDRRDDVQRALAAMEKRVDLIVTTGGVSVGEEDHVKPALRALGGGLVFSGVAIKPGKPVSLGQLGGATWLGLPGNPLAALVTWQVFGRALVRQLSGDMRGPPRTRTALSTRAIQRKAGRQEYRPARLVDTDNLGRDVVDFGDHVQSGHVGHLPHTDGLIIIPAQAEQLPAGAPIQFLSYCDT